MTFCAILNSITFLWLLTAIVWTHRIIADSTVKIKYFGKEFVSELRDLNLTIMANTIQSSKITVVWTGWVKTMKDFYQNLKWMQYYVIISAILFGIFHVSSILIPISLAFIVGSTILSLFFIKHQHNIIDHTGKVINTVITSSYLLKRDSNVMTDSQKNDLQKTIDFVGEQLDLLLVNQTGIH